MKGLLTQSFFFFFFWVSCYCPLLGYTTSRSRC